MGCKLIGSFKLRFFQKRISKIPKKDCPAKVILFTVHLFLVELLLESEISKVN